MNPVVQTGWWSASIGNLTAYKYSLLFTGAILALTNADWLVKLHDIPSGSLSKS
jgi:hypothetical protein